MPNREKQIIRVSIIGIITNLILAGSKFTVGFLSSSIAIMVDALNNTSDVLSSVVTVIGAKLAGRPADRAHPYGHGRIEYLSAAVISAIVLYAGVTAFAESLKKIIDPVEPEYTELTLIVVAGGIAAKIILGRYVSIKGKELSSDALKDSGQDALMDAATSSSTLIGAFLFILFKINLEAWLGILISIVIIKAGLDMFKETTSKILGERVSSEITKSIKETVCKTEGIIGAYDLVLTNYGPDKLIGSIHVEVPDDWTAGKIDTASREIIHNVFVEHNILITAVGVYSHNMSNSAVQEIKNRIHRAALSQEYVLQLHGFYCDLEKHSIRFDIVVDFSAHDMDRVHDKVLNKAKELYPDYDITIQVDSDFAD